MTQMCFDFKQRLWKSLKMSLWWLKTTCETCHFILILLKLLHPDFNCMKLKSIIEVSKISIVVKVRKFITNMHHKLVLFIINIVLQCHHNIILMILSARHKHLTLNTLLKCCVKAQTHRGDKFVISKWVEML